MLPVSLFYRRLAALSAALDARSFLPARFSACSSLARRLFAAVLRRNRAAGPAVKRLTPDAAELDALPMATPRFRPASDNKDRKTLIFAPRELAHVALAQ